MKKSIGASIKNRPLSIPTDKPRSKSHRCGNIKYIDTITRLKLCEYTDGRYYCFQKVMGLRMIDQHINSNRSISRMWWITSLPMAGSPLRPLQGGSRRTTLLREPRKLVSRTRTEERHAGWSSRARREVSAAPGGVTSSGTSGGPRSSMPLPCQRSHRNPPCSDASRCSHSSTARS